MSEQNFVHVDVNYLKELEETAKKVDYYKGIIDGINMVIDRKTEPQIDCKMPYEDCEDCETHLKVQYGDCNKCKWYGDKQVCGRCRSRNLYAPKDKPQTNKDFEVTYTCSFTDCDNFKNPDYVRCIECKRKQSEAKYKTEPRTERSK